MSSGSELLVTYHDWLKWSQGPYNMLPIVLKQPFTDDFAIQSWERMWTDKHRNAFVLESGKGGRYTYLGLNPSSIIHGKGEDCVISDDQGIHSKIKSPLKAVQDWLQQVKAPSVTGAPDFIGGCVGFWGYDVVRTIERLPVSSIDDLNLPDYCFYRMDELWIVDHEQSILYAARHVPVDHRTNVKEEYKTAVADVQEMNIRFLQTVMEPDAKSERRRKFYESLSTEERLRMDIDAIAGIQTSFNKATFAQAVEKVQRYIRDGDVFQVNLSTRQSLRLTTQTPEEIYEWLRLMNPSPYMGLFKNEHYQLVSASPELLIKLQDGQMSTWPIAGTRSRGRNAAEDQVLQTELKASDKDQAEHVMLVDLLRNDLGRVSAYGSIKVADWMKVECYSHVMHLVSKVTGKLASNKDGFDLIAAVFPGGTITGAPKIRTMEIIEELEPVRRGPYTGSIGWIDYQGNMEFNIVIRTLTVTEGIGHVQAGAGIVIDSNPEWEYKESLDKAKALWKAVEYCNRLNKGE